MLASPVSSSPADGSRLSHHDQKCSEILLVPYPVTTNSFCQRIGRPEHPPSVTRTALRFVLIHIRGGSSRIFSRGDHSGRGKHLHQGCLERVELASFVMAQYQGTRVLDPLQLCLLTSLHKDAETVRVWRIGDAFIIGRCTVRILDRDTGNSCLHPWLSSVSADSAGIVPRLDHNRFLPNPCSP